MNLRELASSSLYVSLLSALDLGRLLEADPATPGQRPRTGEPEGVDFEDTVPAWVMSGSDGEESADAS
jgi:hypothetical protein